MNIDNTTGLPELPNGDWWEVRRRKVSHFNYLSYSYDEDFEGYEVAWLTPNKSKTKWVYKRRHWYSLSKSGFYEYSEEPVTYASAPINTFDTITGSKIATNITAALIRATAQALVKRKSDEILTASLLGKYPPNKLP